MPAWLRYGLVAALSAMIALAASHFANTRHNAAGGELHALVHDKLALDAAQKTRIDALDKAFAGERQALDARLRAANARIADAIASEHQYGPKVANAVDQSHLAMGDLQKATLRHVFAMRAVLTPQQAEVFDREIARTLTAPDRN